MTTYEQVSKELAAATKFIDLVWNRVGRPDDCQTNAGWAVVKACVQAWEKFYKNEVAAWYHDRMYDLTHERTVSEHADGFGYNMAGFPPTLFQMLKIMLPKQSLTDRKFLKKLTTDFPLFKTTNLNL